MRFLTLLLLPTLMLAGCGGTRLALSPAQCKAPTTQEAKLTQSVWQAKTRKPR